MAPTTAESDDRTPVVSGRSEAVVGESSGKPPVARLI